MKIIFFKSTRNPVLDFILSLEKQDRSKVLSCLKNIEELGFECPRVQFRQIKDKLWEIKISGANGGYRIFYVTLKRDAIVLLHAYKKQSQRAPTKAIDIAQKRLLEVLSHENDYLKRCH